MKKFFVSKSDTNRIAFIKKAIREIKPNKIHILCERDRKKLYEGIDALILPLKDLNKADKWIEFTKTVNENCLLIIDNVLKCIYFGDGKKEYLKNIAQSLKNVIVTDVVPFYTEPHEIFYPFYLLGKNILGYGSYNSFKGNHFEEKQDGSVDFAHSFAVLKDKIKDYYVQDYDCFFRERHVIEWGMSESELAQYNQDKQTKAKDYTNPIQMMTVFADYINLLPSKISKITSLIDGNTALVINYANYEKKIRAMLPILTNIDFLSYHEKDYSIFSKYDTVIFYDNILVKPHNLFYIEPFLRGRTYCFLETSSKIDRYLFDRVYNISLRNQFDSFFYAKNL